MSEWVWRASGWAKRLRKIGELYWWQANEAHNGYLETYLNLGLIGLFILVGWIVATFRKSRLEFLGNFEFGRFRLSYFAAAVIYNWTESGFRSLHPIWFVFFIIAMDYPRRQDEFATDHWEMADSEAKKGDGGLGLMKPSLAEQDATENWPGGCPIIGNRFLRGGSVVVVSFFVALLLTFLATANAATIPAASVSLTDVRAAVNLASVGDTVTLPAGVASWTSALTFKKSITLQGAGIGQTIIRDGLRSGAPNPQNVVLVNTTAGRSYRLTGIEFQPDSSAHTIKFGQGFVKIDGMSNAVRVDHCRSTT